MRFNDTVNHQLAASGVSVVRACNTTGSAATIRIFNVPDADQKAINIATVDQDNAVAYDYSVAANDVVEISVNPQYPVIVRNGTGNAINWSTR